MHMGFLRLSIFLLKKHILVKIWKITLLTDYLWGLYFLFYWESIQSKFFEKHNRLQKIQKSELKNGKAALESLNLLIINGLFKLKFLELHSMN